jgi:hypothetical protein
MLNLTVQSVHFDDFDGHQFERLVFAYLLRTDNWLSIEWYGQAGGDSGRDFWGGRERDFGGRRLSISPVIIMKKTKTGSRNSENGFKGYRAIEGRRTKHERRTF